MPSTNRTVPRAYGGVCSAWDNSTTTCRQTIVGDLDGDATGDLITTDKTDIDRFLHSCTKSWCFVNASNCLNRKPEQHTSFRGAYVSYETCGSLHDSASSKFQIVMQDYLELHGVVRIGYPSTGCDASLESHPDIDIAGGRVFWTSPPL